MIEIIACSLAYRFRGGGGNEWLRKKLGKPVGWELSNIYGRSVWSLVVTFCLPLSYASPLVFALAYLGCAVGYFGGEFDLGKKENRTWENYIPLTMRGGFIMLPLAAVFSSLYPQLWLGVLAGMLFVPCYLAGNIAHRYSKFQGHTQWGELFLGATIGAHYV